MNDDIHRNGRRGFWEIWKSQLSWELDSEREGSTFGARWGQTNLCATGAARNGRWKSLHRKIVPLSPYVEKPFNSNVIKSFVPELRSRMCFSCFGIPMFYVYMLWTFFVRFPYSCMGILQLQSRYYVHFHTNTLGKGMNPLILRAMR